MWPEPQYIQTAATVSVPSWAVQRAWPEAPPPFTLPCDVPIKLVESCARCHSVLGMAYHALGHWDRARLHLENAVMAWPLLLAARFHLGVVLAELAGLRGARRVACRDVDADIESNVSLNQQAREHLSIALALCDSGSGADPGDAPRAPTSSLDAWKLRVVNTAVESSVRLLVKRGLGAQTAAVRELWLGRADVSSGAVVLAAGTASAAFLMLLQHAFESSPGELNVQVQPAVRHSGAIDGAGGSAHAGVHVEPAGKSASPPSPKRSQSPPSREQLQRSAQLLAHVSTLSVRAQAWQALAGCSEVLLPSALPLHDTLMSSAVSLSPEQCHSAAVKDLSIALECFADLSAHTVHASSADVVSGVADAVAGKAHYLRALSLLALRRPAGAARDCLSALRCGYDLKSVHAKLAQTQAYVGDWNAAEREYGAALSLAPGDAALLRGRAEVRRASGRTADALADLNCALQSQADVMGAPPPPDPFQIASARLGASRADAGSTAAILIPPVSHAQLLVDRARVHYERGAMESAVADLRAALAFGALDPRDEARA
jgi:tetratricopeptide (TPR) repeat protein